jgi:hypothetical protein
MRKPRHSSIHHCLTVFRCEVTVGRRPLRINRAMLLWSRLGWGFLRALSESQFLRSKNGRVAQQPAQPAEQWPIRRGLRPTATSHRSAARQRKIGGMSRWTHEGRSGCMIVVCKTVARMDACLEPPWMGSRRVWQTTIRCRLRIRTYKQYSLGERR